MRKWYAIVAVAGYTVAGCSTVQAPEANAGSKVHLANSIWNIVSVSGDALAKPGSTLTFRRQTFQAALPCSVVSGSFSQQGSMLRTTAVRTTPGGCEATGAEKYFAGKISQGEAIQSTGTEIILQNPPDSIELMRR